MQDKSVLIPRGALPLPAEIVTGQIRNWLEYGLWGLMLHDNQAPWFVLIECLQILHSQHEKGQPLFPGPRYDGVGKLAHERIEYSVPKNMILRHLLFRDREVMRLRGNHLADASPLWEELVSQTKKATDGKLDVAFLKDTFHGDFNALANALDLLRSAEVESFGAQRWTSRHLLPLGPNMLFADIDEKGNIDRLIFRRTGEILWMMLGRASKARAKLTEVVTDRLLNVASPWDRLARNIARPQNEEKFPDVEKVKFNTGYLPMPSMEVYERLAEDWIALLSLKRIQVEMLLDPLMRISGLHQIIYIMDRSNDEYKGMTSPIVLDLFGSAQRNPIQKLAADIYEAHRKLPLRAAEAYLNAYAETDEWKGILGKISRKKEAYDLIKHRLLWPGSQPAPSDEALQEPRDQLDKVLEAYQKSSHTIWSTFANLSRKIGLVVARQRAGTWYMPNDNFLEAIVLANVTTPVEVGEFLQKLYKRYRIVIGPREAREAFKDNVLIEPFHGNVARLEERLRMLGLVDRKSDACAFVLNPYCDQEPGN